MTTTIDRPAFGLPGRIQDPNSKPRSIALVGIGEGGAAIARNIKSEDLAQLDVHTSRRARRAGTPSPRSRRSAATCSAISPIRT